MRTHTFCPSSLRGGEADEAIQSERKPPWIASPAAKLQFTLSGWLASQPKGLAMTKERDKSSDQEALVLWAAALRLHCHRSPSIKITIVIKMGENSWLVSFGRAIRVGFLAIRSDDVERLTGHPARSVRQMIEENADLLRSAAA